MSDMVMVVAYVRRTRRMAVGQSLRQIEVDGWTESDILGHGQAAAGHGVEHVRFEVVVPVGRAAFCTETIATAGSTETESDVLVVTLPVLSVSRSAGGPSRVR
jgi:nitrogen regulatory protein PII